MVTRPSRITARIAATLSAVLVVTLTAAAVAAGYVFPAAPTSAPELPSVTVGAGSTDLVCPGPPRLPTAATGDDIDYDLELGPGPDGVDTLVQTSILDGAEATIGPVDEDGNSLRGSSTETDITGPTLIRADAQQDESPLMSADTWAHAETGDLRGLSAAACAVPTSTSWLIGGSTAVGSSSQLTLTNTGQTPARVQMTGWTGSGPAEDASPVLLAPGQSRVVLLEALWVADQLAVQLEAEGGRITAAIQDSRLDGLVPAGSDFVTAAAAPDTETMIPPVPLPAYSPDDDGDEEAGGDDDSESPKASLRMVNPNDEPATVAVSTLGEDGEEPVAGAQELIVDPGSVSEIPLSARSAGDYGLRLSSDLPVSGAVQLARTGEPGEADPDTPPVDIGWLPAATPAPDSLIPTAPDAADSTLTVLNPNPQETSVQATPIDTDGEAGSPVAFDIAGGASAPLPDDETDIDEVTAWRIEADDPVLTSLIATSEADDGTHISALAATEDINQASEVEVDLQID